ETDAIRGLAYGFLVYRMIGDDRHFDRANYWVYRLFAYEQGQSFPDRRFHFVPVPQSILPSHWIQTTFRIKHLASLDEQHRAARFEKYRLIDPNREFQNDYDHLLDRPGTVREWQGRLPGKPVLPAAGERPASGDPVDAVDQMLEF